MGPRRQAVSLDGPILLHRLADLATPIVERQKGYCMLSPPPTTMKGRASSCRMPASHDLRPHGHRFGPVPQIRPRSMPGTSLTETTAPAHTLGAVDGVAMAVLSHAHDRRDR